MDRDPSVRSEYFTNRKAFRFALSRDDYVERYWSRVNKSDGCWNWTGTTNSSKGRQIPHGFFVVTKKHFPEFFDGRNSTSIVASRFAWFLEYGKVPPKHLFVCHHCDNPLCVRPDHLFLGTAADNTADMLRKGRAPKPRVIRNARRSSVKNLVRNEIRRMHDEDGWSMRRLSEFFGYEFSSVYRIIREPNRSKGLRKPKVRSKDGRSFIRSRA